MSNIPFLHFLGEELNIALPEIANNLRDKSICESASGLMEHTLPQEKQRTGMIMLKSQTTNCRYLRGQERKRYDIDLLMLNLRYFAQTVGILLENNADQLILASKL
jgi:hypothetical protein